jgi:regulator of sirC expression with transglutaminase-like and TPR domain
MSEPVPMSQPRYCRQVAYDLFAQHVGALHRPAGLLGAAVAISMHEFPAADPHAVDTELQSYADRIAQRVRSGSVEAKLAHLHEVMFEELGFRGVDRDRYYESANSYLPAVLHTRRGIPISLSLIFANLCHRLGIEARGVDAPGHFLVQVHSERGPLLIDPYFSGQVMAFDDEHVQKRFPGGRDTLKAASNQRWVARMLDNLILLFKYNGRDDDFEAMRELKALLPAD